MAKIINPVPIGQWIRDNGQGMWKFVGVSNEDEVFLENLTDASDEKQLEISRSLTAAFPEVSKTIFVVKPSLIQMEEMVENLNQLLRQEEKPKRNLLGIGNFNG